MPDETDDFKRRTSPDFHPLSDGILSGEKTLREQLIDNHNLGRAYCVLLGKITAGEERNLHRPKIVGCHTGHRSRWPLLRAVTPSFNGEYVPRISSVQRQVIG